jgi:toxin CcdB
MRQFDVHRNAGVRKASIPYVVVVQSRRFELSRRRIVIPLVLQSELPSVDARLHPGFDIEGIRVVLEPLQIVSMAADRLGEHVTSLSNEGDRIIAAIDLVISRAWE